MGALAENRSLHAVLWCRSAGSKYSPLKVKTPSVSFPGKGNEFLFSLFKLGSDRQIKGCREASGFSGVATAWVSVRHRLISEIGFSTTRLLSWKESGRA